MTNVRKCISWHHIDLQISQMKWKHSVIIGFDCEKTFTLVFSSPLQIWHAGSLQYTLWVDNKFFFLQSAKLPASFWTCNQFCVSWCNPHGHMSQEAANHSSFYDCIHSNRGCHICKKHSDWLCALHNNVMT